MTQLTKKQNVQHWAWILCLGILMACRGGESPTSTIAPTLELPVSIDMETSPSPSATAVFALLPTDTNTSITTSTPVPTKTPVPTATLAEPEIITAENAHKIAQIGQPFPLESLLAEFVFRAEATWLVISEDGQQIKVYDLATQKLISTLEDEEVLIERLVVSADGRLLAAVSPSTGKVTLWNLDTFAKTGVFVLAGYQSYPALIPSPTGGEFSSDNHFLVVWGCRIPALNYQGLPVGCFSSGVIIFDLYEGEIYQELNGYQEGTSQVTFSPDISVLVLSGRGESILQADLYVWDILNKQTITEVATAYEFGLTGGKYHPDGSLFVAEANGELVFFDPSLWQILGIQAPGPNLFPYGLVFSKLQPIILIASEGMSGISVRDPQNGSVYHLVNMGIGIIYNLGMSPDGRFIYSISEDGFVRTWGIP